MLWVDEIEHRSVAAMAAGAEVDPDAERAKFDKWLEAVPDYAADPEKFELMRALGLR